jgi:hypothetical protein
MSSPAMWPFSHPTEIYFEGSSQRTEEKNTLKEIGLEKYITVLTKPFCLL